MIISRMAGNDGAVSGSWTKEEGKNLGKTYEASRAGAVCTAKTTFTAIRRDEIASPSSHYARGRRDSEQGVAAYSVSLFTRRTGVWNGCIHGCRSMLCMTQSACILCT